MKLCLPQFSLISVRKHEGFENNCVANIRWSNIRTRTVQYPIATAFYKYLNI